MKPFYSHFLIPALIFIPLVIGTVFFVKALLADRDDIDHERPGVDGVTYEVRLAEAPTYDSAEYFGLGAAYALVTLRAEQGELGGALIEVDAVSRAFTGYDACDSDFTFRDFTIVAPVGGASNQSTNVTYASETYGSTLDTLPGGQHCAARAGVESEWLVSIRIELDGVRDDLEDRGNRFEVDVWDFETTTILRGRAVG